MKLRARIVKRRTRRTFRVRNTLRASGQLRLSVFRSNRHIYAQIIDDEAQQTLVSASTMESSIGGSGKYAGTVAMAQSIGKLIAERAKEKGITKVAFDRGPYRYHGRVLALAEAAREGGLEF
ncbi:50S ribosomal protein L18 [Lacunimicrobium album]|jgi:large subunit ribosomal protein L18